MLEIWIGYLKSGSVAMLGEQILKCKMFIDRFSPCAGTRNMRLVRIMRIAGDHPPGPGGMHPGGCLALAILPREPSGVCDARLHRCRRLKTGNRQG